MGKRSVVRFLCAIAIATASLSVGAQQFMNTQFVSTSYNISLGGGGGYREETNAVGTEAFSLSDAAGSYTGSVSVNFPASLPDSTLVTVQGQPYAQLSHPTSFTMTVDFDYAAAATTPPSQASSEMDFTLGSEWPQGGNPPCTSNGTSISQPSGSTEHFTRSITCTLSLLKVSFDPSSSIGGMQVSALADFTAISDAPGATINGFLAQFYANYVSTPPSDLNLSVVDPNCSGDVVCNAAFLVEDPATGFTTMRLDEPSTLVTASAARTAVATDGVTLLLIKASVPDTTPDGTTVTLNLVPSDSAHGVLMNRDGTGASSSLTVPLELKSGGRKWAFAAYRPPADHPAPTSTSIRIEAKTSFKPDQIVDKSISLVMPPVILVHGVWSNRGAWEGLEENLRSNGFRVCADCRPDYGTAQPAPEFDPLSGDSKYVYDIVIGAINAARAADRRAGIAVTQIDGVGHSMGGVLLRGRVAYLTSPYLRLDNYKKGDFHKIITVGSPHTGSTVVNFFLDHACDQMTFVAGGSFTNPTLGGFFTKLGRPIGPAVLGFQTSSPALIHIGRTPVPGHAIVGIETAPTSATEDMLNSIFRATNARDANGNPFTIDFAGGGEGQHDTIVNLGSQTGLIGTTVTQFPNVVHADISVAANDVGETASTAIWARIVELLKAPLDGNFGFFQAMTAPPGDRIRTNCAATSQGTKGATAQSELAATESKSATLVPDFVSAKVTSTGGSIVHPGDSIVIGLTTTGTSQTDGALFIVGDRAGSVLGSGPYTLTWIVPSARMGRLDVTVGTFGKGVNAGDETYVIVQPTSAPLSIAVTPSEVTVGKGSPLQLYATAAYTGIAESNITSSTAGTTYRTGSGGTTVISVDADGAVTAKAAGTDTVIVTNGTKSATATITVLNNNGRERGARH